MATFNSNPVRRHPAVKRAWEKARYLDASGHLWTRGYDGWFATMGTDRHQMGHFDMVRKIEEENPE